MDGLLPTLRRWFLGPVQPCPGCVAFADENQRLHKMLERATVHPVREPRPAPATPPAQAPDMAMVEEGVPAQSRQRHEAPIDSLARKERVIAHPALLP